MPATTQEVSATSPPRVWADEVGLPSRGVQVHCLHCTSRSWRPLAELTTLRFVEDAADALVLGPVRVGKTFLASALAHIACRRRFSMHFEWADRLHRRLKATRLDASHDAEMRKLMRVDLFLIADFALRSLDASDAADFCELVVERHRRASTVITANRDPAEMQAMIADPLLAQSAIDRLQSAAFELVVEGESYWRRQKLVVGAAREADDAGRPRARDHRDRSVPARNAAALCRAWLRLRVGQLTRAACRRAVDGPAAPGGALGRRRHGAPTPRRGCAPERGLWMRCDGR